ncbi:hemolysin-type calcium-binding region [Perkinsela sp. CCAP 1560/4]|nr:hemolysin-type calcium-binding region [Perkinsela sp. CCAP 1560/4]|eukprot:KNH06468.1 hemolysin-type calcium-binding region [Perkinsela sp. CCAP 1560/4]
MSFFEAVSFVGHKKPADGRISTKLATSNSGVSDTVDRSGKVGSEVTYRLGFVPPDPKRGVAEIHSIKSELTVFDPTNPPKLTSITSSHWNFQGHRPLKITTENRRSAKLKTSSAEFDKFISNELTYNVLIIEGDQMVLEEVLPGNLKSLNLELPINQLASGAAKMGTTTPLAPARAVTRSTQRTMPSSDAQLEEKMVELEEAAGFDLDAVESDGDNHTKAEVEFSTSFQDDDEPVLEGGEFDGQIE